MDRERGVGLSLEISRAAARIFLATDDGERGAAAATTGGDNVTAGAETAPLSPIAAERCEPKAKGEGGTEGAEKKAPPCELGDWP